MPNGMASAQTLASKLDHRQSLKNLVARCIRVNRNDSVDIQASTFRKNNKNGSVPQWRVIHKVQLQINNAPDNLSCLELEHAEQRLTQKLLDNRNYFNTCRCCGYLNHVNEMQGRLCELCLDHKDDQQCWLETGFINAYIKIQNTPGWFPEEEFDPCAELDASKDLSHLELPAFLKKAQADGEADVKSKQESEDFKREIESKYFASLKDPSDLNSQVNNDHQYGVIVCTLSWDSGRPHEPRPVWKQVKRFDPPYSSYDTESIERETQKVLSDRRYFHTCIHCGGLHHKDHMSERICDSCMNAVYGVMY